MNKIKLDYETPVVRTFVVRFEGALLAGSPYGEQGAAGAKVTNGGIFVFDDDE